MTMETLERIGSALFWAIVGMAVQSCSMSIDGWWIVRNSEWECVDYMLEQYGIMPQLSCNEFARRVK